MSADPKGQHILERCRQRAHTRFAFNVAFSGVALVKGFNAKSEFIATSAAYYAHISCWANVRAFLSGMCVCLNLCDCVLELCLLDKEPARLPACLPTSLPARMPACPPTCLHAKDGSPVPTARFLTCPKTYPDAIPQNTHHNQPQSPQPSIGASPVPQDTGRTP